MLPSDATWIHWSPAPAAVVVAATSSSVRAKRFADLVEIAMGPPPIAIV
jgi:hypothetical protein